MTEFTTDDTRRVQVDFLKECRHEPALNLKRYCHKCGKVIPKESKTGNIMRRTFKSDADLMDVFRRLVETGQWEKFAQFARDRMPLSLVIYDYPAKNYSYESITWLLSLLPSGEWRLVKLVSEALEEGVVT